MSKPGAFQPGHDSRRNTRGRPPSARNTIAHLARDDRAATFKAFQSLRDDAEDERVRLEAAKTLAAYSDGRPVDAVQQPDEEEKPAATSDAEILQLLRAPPPAPKEGE